MTRSSIKKYTLFGAKAAVTILLIWLVVHNIDVADAVARVERLPLWVIPAGLGLLVMQFVFGALRWRIILREFGEDLSFPTAARLFFEGQFFNQALPSTVGGDGVRMYRAYRVGLRLGTAVNSVILDRVMGLASLVLLVAVAQPLFYQIVHDTVARLTFSAIFVVAIAGICVLLGFQHIPERFRRWSVVRGLTALSVAARQAIIQPSVLLPVVLLSVAGHLFTVTVFYLLADNLGLPVTFTDCLVMVPSVLLLATVPISVAGWGLREGAMVAAFGLLGVSAGGAAAVSVLYGFGLILTGLPGGYLWLTNPDRRLSPVSDLPEKESPVA